MKDKINWTDFSPFPSPLQNGYLNAPFGEGVYELKNYRTNQLVYVGESKNVANRMSSLLPKPMGTGTRNNLDLRNYNLQNLQDLYYRTLACDDEMKAKQKETEMKENYKYLFN
jgi:excinuclease UvrABC nuclease subunit